MIRHHIHSLLLLLIATVAAMTYGCHSATNQDAEEKYSFYTVGHAYGNPMKFQKYIYPPLNRFLPYLNENPFIEFGVFTGDVVAKPFAEYWDSTQMNLEILEKPYFIAAGNHDRGEEFENRYPKDTLFTFHKDIFLILNTKEWLLDEQQIALLKKGISILEKNSRLFIFNHELVWWSPENEYREIEINYRPQYPGETNFWPDIYPLLNGLSQKVFWISGDIGSKPECTPYVLEEKGNISFIANGVGGGKDDNVLLFDVSEKAGVKINALLFDKDGRPKDWVTLR